MVKVATTRKCIYQFFNIFIKYDSTIEGSTSFECRTEYAIWKCKTLLEVCTTVETVICIYSIRERNRLIKIRTTGKSIHVLVR